MTYTQLKALVHAALRAFVVTKPLDAVVAALGALPRATVASNDFATLADTLCACGIHADTALVGDAVTELMTPQEYQAAERELPNEACRPGTGLVWFSDPTPLEMWGVS